MNYGIVIKTLGKILVLEAVMMIFPSVVSLLYYQQDKVAFAVTLAVTGLVGIFLSRFPAKTNTIKIREGLTIVTFAWILVSFFGSLPFVFSGSVDSFADAFFETVSGLTTTGATVIDNVEALPRGILFWRSFTHWFGGMGILVLMVSILPALGVGGFQVFKAESTGPVTDRIVPRIKDTAKILYTIYLGITVLGVVLLIIGGMSLFDALVYSFGTVGTGGFATKNLSVGAYNSVYIDIVISLLMLASGVNFSLYYSMRKKKWREVLVDSELRFYLGVVGASVLLIAFNIFKNVYGSIWEALRYALFQVSSIITTTGYSTANFDEWPTFSKVILFVLMFVGGCAGSTAGGMKSVRVLVLLKMIKREIMKIFHPRAVIPVKLGQRALSKDTLDGISSFFALYMFLFVLGTLLVSLDGFDLITSSSAVAATLGNIGPGFGAVGPIHTFSQFSHFSKILMSVLMLLGRLGLFTVIALFSSKFWREDI
ncbi:MAG TPA: TrkH family potassium uptake protein [Acetivibrio sp.]|mgnify:FL=1|nr:TrkH family potassium uptake protein [Acetivibrio sp.]